MAKRLTAIALLLVFVLTVCGCGEKKDDDYPSPTDEFLVNDFADVMTDEDLQSVYSQGLELQKKTMAQVVVVTVEELDDKAISDYAEDIREEWEVGGEEENGAIILMSEDDADMVISAGSGLREVLSEDKAQRIIDTYAVPHLSSKEFSTAIVKVYGSVVNEIYIKHGMEPTEDYTPVAVLPSGVQEQKVKKDGGNVLLAWIIMIAVIIVYVFIFGRRSMFIFGAPKIFKKFQFHSFGKKADNKPKDKK